MFTTYCIENSSPERLVGARNRLTAAIGLRALALWVRLSFHLLDRVAFGTVEAATTYRKAVRTEITQVSHQIFDPLLSVCTCPEYRREPGVVLFATELHERKGFDTLVSIWPAVHARAPDSRLVICGVGRLEDAARRLAEREDVSYLPDLPRSEIHEWFRRSDLLFMFSRDYRRWSEQIGLPLIEALAHGTDILTSDSTGIKEYLVKSGYPVLPQSSNDADVADVLVNRLTTGTFHNPDLPVEYGRMTAQRWLIEGSLV